MRRRNTIGAVTRVAALLALCALLAAGAATRLETPVCTQVYYEQSNDLPHSGAPGGNPANGDTSNDDTPGGDTREHTLYFYLIRNVEDRWGEPFCFCFPEAAAIPCMLRPVADYDGYSRLMEADRRHWRNGTRRFLRYSVTLLELRFTVPEDYVREAPLHLREGKLYFQGGYCTAWDIGDVIIRPAGAAVKENVRQQNGAMCYIAAGDFSERPYFSDFRQVWAYLRARDAIA